MEDILFFLIEPEHDRLYDVIRIENNTKQCNIYHNDFIRHQIFPVFNSDQFLKISQKVLSPNLETIFDLEHIRSIIFLRNCLKKIYIILIVILYNQGGQCREDISYLVIQK